MLSVRLATCCRNILPVIRKSCATLKSVRLPPSNVHTSFSSLKYGLCGFSSYLLLKQGSLIYAKNKAKDHFKLPCGLKPKTDEEVKADLWRFYWGLISEQWLPLLVAILAAFAGAAINILMSIQFGSLINVVTTNVAGTEGWGDVYDIVKEHAKGILFSMLLQAGVTFTYIHFMFIFGQNFATNLRKRLFAHVVELDLQFFMSNRSGEIIHKITQDVEELRSALKHFLGQSIKTTAQLLGSCVSIYFISPPLGVGVVIMLPCCLGIGTLLTSSLKALSKLSHSYWYEANDLLVETLTSPLTVKSLAVEDEHVARFSRQLDRSNLVTLAFGSGIAVVQACSHLFFNGLMLTMVGFGAHQIVVGALSTGDLMAILANSQQLQRSLSQLSHLLGHYVKISERFNDIYALMFVQSTLVNGHKTIPYMSLMGDIELRNVSFSYSCSKLKAGEPEDVPTQDNAADGEDVVKVLNDVSLSIAGGETTALCGPSGSGKSTLAMLLQRFYDVDEGDILLDGVNVKELDFKWLRRHCMAFIPQEPVLFHGTIAENIRMGRPDASEQEVLEAAQMANCSEFVDTLPDGYRTLVGERGATLSGGQKQRVAIARALIKQPSILILDEATSALDMASESAVQKGLELASRGRTVIVIAHRLSTIKNADKIVVLKEGKVVQTGKHTELIRDKRGVYYQFYNSQSPS